MHPGSSGYSSFNCRHISYSPARSPAGQSSSEDSLSSNAVASETPPGTPFPKSGRDTEVSSQRDSEPDKVLEASKAPGSGEQPPSMKGGLTTPPATSVYAELSGGLLTALKNAAVVDEHRTLMGTVVGKIQSTESGLNESCLGLIKAFEVWFLRNL